MFHLLNDASKLLYLCHILFIICIVTVTVAVSPLSSDFRFLTSTSCSLNRRPSTRRSTIDLLSSFAVVVLLVGDSDLKLSGSSIYVRITSSIRAGPNVLVAAIVALPSGVDVSTYLLPSRSTMFFTMDFISTWRNASSASLSCTAWRMIFNV